MQIFLIVLMLVHGLIHLLGFVKAFDLLKVAKLTQNISKPVGILWLLAMLLFVISAILYYFDKDYWWIAGTAAVIISQILIILFWKDAKFGTIANVILIIPLLMSCAEYLPTSYKNVFKNEVEKGLKRYQQQSVLTNEDIKHLPLPVQKYIIYSGAIGKEKVQNFKSVYKGSFKVRPDSDYLNIVSTQYNFYDEPTRVFYIKSKLYGIPFDGLHIYVGPDATMRIKVASLMQVVDAKGPEMNKGETVTLFNDMCVMAPATLIDKNIEWKTIDSLTVKAKFTNQGNTITAILFFNAKGELVDFSSKDRYESADGKIYNNYEWTTPMKDYKEIDGRKIASYAELNWHKPDGKYCYGKFELVSIEYNCKEFD